MVHHPMSHLPDGPGANSNCPPGPAPNCPPGPAPHHNQPLPSPNCPPGPASDQLRLVPGSQPQSTASQLLSPCTTSNLCSRQGSVPNSSKLRRLLCIPVLWYLGAGSGVFCCSISLLGGRPLSSTSFSRYKRSRCILLDLLPLLLLFFLLPPP